MSDKRIIELPASEEIFHDDWIGKDSPLNETTKIQASVFMALIVAEAKEGMVPYTMLATEWTALTTYFKDQVVIYNGKLYRAKDTNVSPTFDPSAWTKISFNTLYRTTLADVKNSICEEWSTSGEYTLNDCAIHEDKLYKCVADTATVGTWVSNEWELVSIYEIIQNLPKSASDVTYDNTDSDLEADNVQDALDEVVETITELSNTTEVTGTASGAIATFTDGADAPLKELKVAVTPYQDLHGYDAPWAGGAGKNKFAGSYYNDCMSENNGVFTNTESDTQSVFRFIIQAFNGSDLIASSSQEVISSSGRYYVSITIPSSVTSLKIKHNGSSKDIGINCQFTATGTFTISLNVTKTNPSTVGGLEFKDVQIESGSQMTSYAPYENICPIIGWDEAVVNVVGKNKFDLDAVTSFIKNGVVSTQGLTNQDGVLTNSKSYGGDGIFPFYYPMTFSSNTITVSADIKLSGNHSSNNVFIQMYNSNGSDVSAVGEVTMSSKDIWEHKTITLQLSLLTNVNLVIEARGTNNSVQIKNVQVEIGSTATTYEPYNGATYTIDLDGTRYGGKVDLVSGVMTLTHGYVDLGSLSWSGISARNGVFGATVNGLKTYSYGNTPDMLCSIYKITPSSYNDPYISANGIIWTYVGVSTIRVKDTAYSDATAFKASVTGQQLVYELATPITVQLAPTAIKSIEGENNISANCGDINNVEYVRNLNITINDLLSRING